MRKLAEGMREGDLEDLVLPLISVDEYESKIDESAVVIGFFVSEHSAAEDLNRFIQRSPVELLDTEISPAPDQHGYYMVFVEMLNNKHLAKNVSEVLDEISALCSIEHWQMQVRGHDDLIPYTDENLSKALKDNFAESVNPVLSYLTPSILRNATLTGDELVLEGAKGRFSFKVIGLGATDSLLVEHGLDGKPVALGLEDVGRCTQIARILGDEWSVHHIDGYDVVQHGATDQALLLQNLSR